MRIAVCVKAVPEPPPGRIHPGTFRLDRSGRAAVNAPDLHAVEQALRLRESAGEGEVVLVSMGPAEALPCLRRPLAMGADRAVLISDPLLAGSDLVASGRVLAAALEQERPDLVLFGQQAVDSEGALLWAAVANRLQLPVVSRAVALEVRSERARVVRRWEGALETLELPLPCIVAVSAAINVPRAPTFRELKAAAGKPSQTRSLVDLGVPPGEVGEAGARTTVLALLDPPRRGGARRVVGAGEGPEQILAYLAERMLIRR